MTTFKGPSRDTTFTVCDSRGGYYDRKVVGSTMPSFPRLLGMARPRAIVVALGTNDVHSYCASGGPNGGQMWIEGARKLANSIPDGLKCVWVLPITYKTGKIADDCKPLGGTAVAIETLAKAVGKCTLVNTSQECGQFVHFDGKDSIHPSESGPLGNCVGEKVRQRLGL